MSGFSRLDAHRTPSFTRTPHPGFSKHDLERDSGFSDASSGYLSAVEVTDSEDAGRNGSIFGQEPAGPQVAVVGGSYPGLPPMIIMNNFVVKQPSSVVPAEKQWNFPSSVEVMPQSQVVLLQPMVSNGNSSCPKAGSENVRQSKSFMPKSYPRIAPHPVDALTKRGESSRLRASAASGYEPRQRRHHHGHRPYSSPSPLPALQTQTQTICTFETTTNQSQAAESQEQLAETSLTPQAGTSALPSYAEGFSTVTDSNTMPADKYQDAISMHSNKLKRFSNTYNVLNKSGLLGITMRTKQLIKDNKRTQGMLLQLQEHTAILLEALSSGDPQLWTKLQLSLQDTEKQHWGPKTQRVLA